MYVQIGFSTALKPWSTLDLMFSALWCISTMNRNTNIHKSPNIGFRWEGATILLLPALHQQNNLQYHHFVQNRQQWKIIILKNHQFCPVKAGALLFRAGFKWRLQENRFFLVFGLITHFMATTTKAKRCIFISRTPKCPGAGEVGGAGRRYRLFSALLRSQFGPIWIPSPGCL